MLVNCFAATRLLMNLRSENDRLRQMQGNVMGTQFTTITKEKSCLNLPCTTMQLVLGPASLPPPATPATLWYARAGLCYGPDQYSTPVSPTWDA